MCAAQIYLYLFFPTASFTDTWLTVVIVVEYMSDTSFL